MSRSLKVAPDCIEQVRLAVQRNRYPNQKALAGDVGLSLSTIKSFLNGRPVDYLNFVELSEKLGLDWQAIAKIPQTESNTTILGEASPFITGTPITHPRNFFGRHRELKRLFDLLKRHPLQNAAIIGKRRSGKTSLLHYLKLVAASYPFSSFHSDHMACFFACQAYPFDLFLEQVGLAVVP